MTEKKQVAAKKVTKEKKPTPVLYVGPTLSGIGIFGTVYSDIPPAAREAQKKAPQLLNLFIEIRKYGVAEQMLRTHKGYIWSAYREAWTNLRAAKH